MIISLNDGSKKTKSYARYLKEVEIGRELDPDLETVDHIDRNHHNDKQDNTQLLTRSENASKSALRLNTDVYDNCKMCGLYFQLTKYQIKNRGKAGPFCSRKCSGKYGALYQNGKIDKIDPHTHERTYYRNDD